MTEKTTSSSGIGFPAALALLFVGLKLGGVIDWSWWWVLSPLWISFVVTSVVSLTIIVLCLWASK